MATCTVIMVSGMAWLKLLQIVYFQMLCFEISACIVLVQPTFHNHLRELQFFYAFQCCVQAGKRLVTTSATNSNSCLNLSRIR